MKINVGDRVEIDENDRVTWNGYVVDVVDVADSYLCAGYGNRGLSFIEFDTGANYNGDVVIDTSQQDAIYITGPLEYFKVNPELNPEEESALEQALDSENFEMITKILDGEYAQMKADKKNITNSRRRRRRNRNESRVESVIRNLSKGDYGTAEKFLREALDRKAHAKLMERQNHVAQAIFGGSGKGKKP